MASSSPDTGRPNLAGRKVLPGHPEQEMKAPLALYIREEKSGFFLNENALSIVKIFTENQVRTLCQ